MFLRWEKDLYQAFHEITEFFVRKLDYRIWKAFIWHICCIRQRAGRLRPGKNTGGISEWRERREEERKKEENSFPSDGIFNMEEEEDADISENMYQIRSDTAYAMEEKERYGPMRKVIGKIRTGRWGNWQDMITEIDGQDDTGKI